MGRVLNEFIRNKGMLFDVYAFVFVLLKCFLEKEDIILKGTFLTAVVDFVNVLLIFQYILLQSAIN